MRNISTIAQSFYDQVTAVSSLSRVEFITSFTIDDLKQITRTPLMWISPHMMYPAYGHHRQRGTQFLIDTYLVSRHQRLERNKEAALEFISVLDDIDNVLVNKTFGLDIQPFDVYRRDAVDVEKGLSVVRTIYYTVIFDELASSRFAYLDSAGSEAIIDFSLISTSFQEEEIKDTNDYDRSLDGDLRAYTRTTKKRFSLRFTLIPSTLKDHLWAMKIAGTEITFYRYKDSDPTMTCFWTNDFNFYEERTGYWTGFIVLNEG